jgi:hypothetical protein
MDGFYPGSGPREHTTVRGQHRPSGTGRFRARVAPVKPRRIAIDGAPAGNVQQIEAKAA